MGWGEVFPGFLISSVLLEFFLICSLPTLLIPLSLGSRDSLGTCWLVGPWPDTQQVAAWGDKEAGDRWLQSWEGGGGRKRPRGEAV